MEDEYDFSGAKRGPVMTACLTVLVVAAACKPSPTAVPVGTVTGASSAAALASAPASASARTSARNGAAAPSATSVVASAPKPAAAHRSLAVDPIPSALAGPKSYIPAAPLAAPKQIDLEDPFKHVFRVRVQIPVDWKLDDDQPSACRETFWANTWLSTGQVSESDCTAMTLYETAYGGDRDRVHSGADVDDFLKGRAADVGLTIVEDVMVGKNRSVVMRGLFRGKAPSFAGYCVAYNDRASALIYLHLRGPAAAENVALAGFKKACGTLQWVAKLR